MKRRSLTIFTVAFTVVLVAGVALAQVGTFSVGSDDPVAMFDAASELTVPVGDEQVGDEADEPEVVEPEHRSEIPEVDKTDGTEPEANEPEANEAEADEPEAEADEPEAEADEPEHEPAGPEFSIDYPENETRFDRAVAVFEGSVQPGATVHRGKYQAEVSDDGWRIELVLAPGKNVVSFLAVDETGNETERSVTVFYDAPAADEGDKGDKGEEPPPAEVEFEAYQKYGSCSEPVPYDVFYGRATPGATVWIESPYGSATTTANDRGKWEAKVTFPEAPFDDPFTVVIESSDGGRAVFSFVRTGAEHEG